MLQTEAHGKDGVVSSEDPSKAGSGLNRSTRRRGSWREAPRVSELSDPRSSMTPRFNFIFAWFARRFFGHFDLDPESVERIRSLESRGAMVYVMRYSSRLDYFLFNTLFLRDSLRLSSFANGIHLQSYRPFWPTFLGLFRRKRSRSRAVAHGQDQRFVQRLTRNGESFFLFLRTERLRTFWRGLWRLRHRQDELDLLEEVVREARAGQQPVCVVPLCIFWRKGPRRTANRFLNLDYGSLSRPSDLAKVGSFFLNYRSLSVKIGDAIDVQEYIASHPDQSQTRITRTIRRSILIYLAREEKVVEGPTLRSSARVLREILADSGVRVAMKDRASRRRGSMQKAERDVERAHREIAARMNSTLLAFFALVAGALLRRLFSGIDISGLDEVAEHAKRNPLVLVPTHRSYLDFIIVSLLFYNSYLVPPHIAARDNMRFGPFGLIFRMAGAFYLRRSFSDPLYKQVFRAYLAYLVREGFTQEFFIEGGRSRTGRTLSPRLGMVKWNLDAFLESSRKDLFFVPIAITYERLVEESGMVDELEGGRKANESTWALLRARKVLRRRFGPVRVSFGQPLSLARSLGDRRARFQAEVRGEVSSLLAGGSESEVAELAEEIADEKRIFVEEFGHRIVERLNWSVVAHATSVLSSVLLGSFHRGVLREDLIARSRELVDFLESSGISLTHTLRADRADFSESIAFMLKSDLIRSVSELQEEIIFFESSRRRALDLYRNSIAHYLATPSVLARRLLAGGSRKEILDDLESWRGLLYGEYFVPAENRTPEAVDRLLDDFESRGWLEAFEGRVHVTDVGRMPMQVLATQTQGVFECYEAVCRAVMEIEWPVTEKALLNAASVCFEHARLLGRVTHEESGNETTFGNAIEWLRAEQILLLNPQEEQGTRSGRGGKVYAPGENLERLPAVQARLASASAGG